MANTKPEKVTGKHEQKLTGLVLGTIKPTTASDKKMLQQIKAIQAKGRIVEIPQEFI